MRRFSLVVVTSGLLLAARDAAAELPLNELFQSEAVYPQEAGEVQLTLRPLYRSGDEASATETLLGVEYGITDRWQLEAAIPALVHVRPAGGSSTSGVGDVELGTKYAFMDIAGSGFHAALAFEVTLPAGDPERGLGEGVVEYEPSLILHKELGIGLELFSQVGVALVDRVRGDDDEPATHELTVNAGAFWPWRRWTFVGEVNWTTNEWNHDGDESALYVTPGIVRRLPGTWEVSLGVPIGLNEGADDYRVMGTLIYELDL